MKEMDSFGDAFLQSGPIAAAGLVICGALQGAGGGFFAAAGAADIEVFQVGFLADFRIQEAFFELEPARADEFGFEHRLPLSRARKDSGIRIQAIRSCFPPPVSL
jgi:hypothetical protein